jgi:hypothetical protein
MNPILKKSLKVTASILTLLLLAIAIGVGYVWYAGQNDAPSIQSSTQPVKGSGGAQMPQRAKIPDDAKIGASVQTITSPFSPGSNSSIMIKTNPEAACTITVTYDKTESKDSGLVQKKADEYGLVEWTWTVPQNAPLGEWPVEVTCANKKYTAVVENDLRVVKTLE